MMAVPMELPLWSKTAETPMCFLIHYAPNHGKGMAVRTGMLTAKGNIIICTDADLAYGVTFLDVFWVVSATTDTEHCRWLEPGVTGRTHIRIIRLCDGSYQRDSGWLYSCFPD